MDKIDKVNINSVRTILDGMGIDRITKDNKVAVMEYVMRLSAGINYEMKKALDDRDVEKSIVASKTFAFLSGVILTLQETECA